MIQPGQTYRSLSNRHHPTDGPTRIRIASAPIGASRITRYAHCFSHGVLHTFAEGDTPWCTATWIAFTATTRLDALAAKRAAYGEAQFLHELPADKQIEVIEITEARTGER